MRRILYAVGFVFLCIVGSFAQQSGGSFIPGFDYTIPGAWTFSGTSPVVTTAGTASGSVVTVGGTQTLTSKTLTSPTLTAPAISGAGSVTGLVHSDIKALAAAFDVDSGTSGSTLTSLTGVSWTVVAGATYRFRMLIPKITQTTNSGSKMAFKLTTATLTSVNLRVQQSTDTDNTGAVSTNFTTTTDQATWFAQNAVNYTFAEVAGTIVVNAGGTLAVQAAQNAAHADNTTIDAGALFELVRVL